MTHVAFRAIFMVAAFSLKDLENSLTYLCFRRGNPEKIFMDAAKTGATCILGTTI
jgi:hypothetical protein